MRGGRSERAKVIGQAGTRDNCVGRSERAKVIGQALLGLDQDNCAGRSERAKVKGQSDPWDEDWH